MGMEPWVAEEQISEAVDEARGLQVGSQWGASVGGQLVVRWFAMCDANLLSRRTEKCDLSPANHVSKLPTSDGVSGVSPSNFGTY